MWNVIEAYSDGTTIKKADVELAVEFITGFREQLELHKTSKRLIRLIEDRAVCFGPKRKGPNILLNKYLPRDDSLFQRMKKLAKEMLGVELQTHDEVDASRLDRLRKQDNNRDHQLQEVLTAHEVSSKDLINSVTTGFDIATRSGPLFDEAVMGVVFIIESIELV